MTAPHHRHPRSWLVSWKVPSRTYCVRRCRPSASVDVGEPSGLSPGWSPPAQRLHSPDGEAGRFLGISAGPRAGRAGGRIPHPTAGCRRARPPNRSPPRPWPSSNSCHLMSDDRTNFPAIAADGSQFQLPSRQCRQSPGSSRVRRRTLRAAGSDGVDWSTPKRWRSPGMATNRF